MGLPVKHAAVAVAALSVFLPLLFRIVSSPLTILFLTPLFLLLVFLTYLLGHIALANALDRKIGRARPPLNRAARPLAFSTPAAWQAVLTRSQWAHKSPQSLTHLIPEYPMLSGTLNEVLIMIVRDFVLVWYKEISSSPSFPTAVSATMHSSMERLLDRVAALDVPELVVKRILPKLTTHIEQFRQSEVALRGAGLERRLTQSEELDLLLASRYAGRGAKLHPAVNNLSSTFTRQTEEEHLRKLVEKALPHILPENEAQSAAVKLVTREIVACAVLFPVTEMLSDPDFWNRTLDTIAGAAIRQQKLVSKVRNVLEAQSSPRGRPPTATAETLAPETITINTDPRHFDAFLRSIGRCSSLLDARRLKNDISGEIRRTRGLLNNHENEDWINGQKTEDVVSFLDRLYTARRKIEQRIVVLGGEADADALSDGEPSPRMNLRDVLTNPSSLSYLMEFMDRRQRSLLVQFWLTVESFKNPLESVDSSSSGDEEDVVQSSDDATVKEDISMIRDLYFSGPAPPPALTCISPKYVESIKAFVASPETLSSATERKVKRSVMLAQRQAEQEMEQDFADFRKSELWFRVVGDVGAGAARTRISSNKIGASPKLGKDSAANAPGGIARIKDHPILRSDSSTSLGIDISSPARAFPSASFMTPPLMSPTTPKASTSSLNLLMGGDEAGEETRTPLFDDPDDSRVLAPDEVQQQRMDAIHAALSDIILEQKETETSITASLIKPRGQSQSSPGRSSAQGKKRRVLFEDEVHVDEDDEPEAEEKGTGSSQLATPGDLHLSYEIARLGEKINNLRSQDGMLNTLIRKAELTGDAQELRLLRQSKSSLDRELRELTFQKTQYEQQESANRLVSDRTKVSIMNSATGDENGKSVVRYLVEVQQLASDGGHGSGWVVARRYNEFLNMHNKLRERYALVKNLSFPGKRIVTALSSSFVDTRRTDLEKYMQNLVAIPAVCESVELRAFLSRDSPFIASEAPAVPKGAAFPGQKLVRSVYKSVTDSIDDMFFGPSMLDVMIQRLTRQAAEYVGIVGSGVTDEDLVAQALKASGKGASEDALARLTGDLRPLEGETSTSTFSAPICDLILALFELDEKNNWLRRQAIVIILQQVLGTTIERKLREAVKTVLDESRLLTFLTAFRDGLWPGGKLKPPSVPRTPEEKVQTRDEANRKLSALIPDLAANMIGRSNARRGARRIFAVLQNRRLNQHIVYTIVDEVFNAIFPDTPS